MRKGIAVFLMLCILLACLPVFAEAEPKAVLYVSAPDLSGKIEAVLKVFNVDFQAFDAVISYNKDVAELDLNSVKQNFGQNATAHDGTQLNENLFSLVKADSNLEKGLLFVSGMTNLNQTVPNKYVSENFSVSADDGGITIATITFNKIKDGDAKIKFATKNDENFAENIPDGVTLAQNGREMPFTAEVKTQNQDEIISYYVEGTKTSEDSTEKRKERIKDTLILQIGNYAAAKDGNLCHIDPSNKKVVPFTENERTLVPLRFIAESLGLDVKWSDETQTVTLSLNQTDLKFAIGSDSYQKDGVSYSLDCPALLKEERTFVPLRAVSEAFDKDVCWIENNECVVISPKDKPWDTKNSTEQKLLNDALLIMSPFVRDLI